MLDAGQIEVELRDRLANVGLAQLQPSPALNAADPPKRNSIFTVCSCGNLLDHAALGEGPRRGCSLAIACRGPRIAGGCSGSQAVCIRQGSGRPQGRVVSSLAKTRSRQQFFFFRTLHHPLRLGVQFLPSVVRQPLLDAAFRLDVPAGEERVALLVPTIDRTARQRTQTTS